MTTVPALESRSSLYAKRLSSSNYRNLTYITTHWATSREVSTPHTAQRHLILQMMHLAPF